MKKTVLIISLLAILLSMASLGKGLGLRSDNLFVNIDYEPGFEASYGYSILLYGSEIRDIRLYAADDSHDGTTSELAKYFTFSETLIKNVGPGESPVFHVKVRLPRRIDEPGDHKIHVGAVEMFPGQVGVGAKTAIEALFFINVLHDGQYLIYSIEANDINQGDPLPVKLKVGNLGRDKINSLYADVKLSDFNKKVISEKRTKTISLEKRENKELDIEFSTSGFLPGRYNVNATIRYDGKENSIGKEIKLGELKLRIANQTKSIFADKINEIEISIESQWADTLKAVYSSIKIGDKNPVRTLPEDVKGFQKKKLTAFFDAAGMKAGDYDMVTTVYFEDKETTKTTKINVVKEPVRIPLANLTLTNAVFLIVIVIIIIINISLFIILMKKKDEHENQR